MPDLAFAHSSGPVPAVSRSAVSRAASACASMFANPDKRFRWVLGWFIAQLAALAIHEIAFGIVLAAVAGLGGWQSVPSRGIDDRLTAAALAGLLSLSGLFDLRLAGLVIIGAVVGSAIVGWQGARTPGEILTRTGALVLAWLVVSVPAGAVVAVSRESIAAAVVLVCVVFAYDTGRTVSLARTRTRNRANTTGGLAGRNITGGLAGRVAAYVTNHVVGLIGAAAIIFAATSVSIPPYAPDDALRLIAIALATLPLGLALAAAYKNLPHRPDTWALCRLDALVVLGPVWLWALDVIHF